MLPPMSFVHRTWAWQRTGLIADGTLRELSFLLILLFSSFSAGFALSPFGDERNSGIGISENASAAYQGRHAHPERRSANDAARLV